MAFIPHSNNPVIRNTTKRLGLALTLPLLLALSVGCGAAAGPESAATTAENAPEAARSIVWGKADLEPTDAINKWQPTVDYLAANLGEVGVTKGEMKIAPDSETLGQWMADGEVDVLVDSFYPAMIVSDASGAEPLAVRETGKADKHAVFFINTGDSVGSLADLAGQTIAFAEPDSTSGFMLPLAHLREQGFQTVEVPSADAAVAADEIGYVFAGDDDVVATWVLSGRVNAGAVDNKTFNEFAENNPGKLDILSETGSISSNNIVLVRQDLDPALAQAIKQVLLEMENTPEGQAVLKGTKTVSFGEIYQEASADWTRTREQYLTIKN